MDKYRKEYCLFYLAFLQLLLGVCHGSLNQQILPFEKAIIQQVEQGSLPPFELLPLFGTSYAIYLEHWEPVCVEFLWDPENTEAFDERIITFFEHELHAWCESNIHFPNYRLVTTYHINPLGYEVPYGTTLLVFLKSPRPIE